MTQNPQRYLSPDKVIEDHGGDLEFWRSWLHGEVAGDVKMWMRELASSVTGLAADLLSIEAGTDEDHLQVVRSPESSCMVWREFLDGQPEPDTERALSELRRALFVRPILAQHACSSTGETSSLTWLTDETLTKLAANSVADRDDESPRGSLTPVIKSADDGRLQRLKDAVSASLAELLDEIDVQIPRVSQPAELLEVQLLHQIVGSEAIRTFRQHSAWVEHFRGRCYGRSLTALDRVLTSLVPELIAKCRGYCKYSPSFRLLMRERLLEFLTKQRWVDEAAQEKLSTLTRERIGELVVVPLSVVEQEHLEAETSISVDAAREQLALSP